jgi:hypothetical protein
MKFSAAEYLQISDRLLEKGARCEAVETMGRLLGLANRLRHRARQLEPPTSEWLTPKEIERLRRTSQLNRLFASKWFEARERPPA